MRKKTNETADKLSIIKYKNVKSAVFWVAEEITFNIFLLYLQTDYILKEINIK